MSEYYVGLVEGSPNMVVAIDTSFLIVTANKPFADFIEKTFGKTPNINVEVSKIISPDNESMLKDMIENFTRALIGESKTVIHRFIQGKLAGSCFEMAFYPIRNAESIIIGAGCMIKDVTKRVETEEYLDKVQIEANTIFDSVPAWIFIKDKNNKYVRINKNYAEAFGVPKGEIIGKTPFDFYSKKKAEEYLKDDQEVLTTGRPKNNIVESLVTKNGVLWARTDKIPYRDVKGNIIGTIGFVVDITQQKIAEEDAKVKNSELEKFNKLFIDRETKMIELKDEIEKLKKELGQ